MAADISEISSPSHDCRVTRSEQSPRLANVQLSQPAPLDRDFVLLVSVQEAFQPRCIAAHSETGTAMQLYFAPPEVRFRFFSSLLFAFPLQVVQAVSIVLCLRY